MGERLNPLRFRAEELPAVERRVTGRPGVNRHTPTMRVGGHGFVIVALFELERVVFDVKGREHRSAWPLFRCALCFELAPGWLVREGFVGRCSAPRPALPPATQHRDPRRARP